MIQSAGRRRREFQQRRRFAQANPLIGELGDLRSHRSRIASGRDLVPTRKLQDLSPQLINLLAANANALVPQESSRPPRRCPSPPRRAAS